MILAIDVGNTNIIIGLFDKDELIATFRMTTKIPRTSDEYGIFINELILTKGLTNRDIDDVIIASVVPNIMYSLNSAIIKYFDVTPMIVGSGMKTGIKIRCANPKEVGADRIVDAVAAYTLYGSPAIVVDFGTATTYDVINENGEFIAGITAPGIKTSANAMSAQTAKLPEVEIVKPESILAKDTVSSIQAGLIFGAIGQTQYIIDEIIRETGFTDVKCVATGGLGKAIAEATDRISIFDSDLTLKGLNIIYKKNKNKDK